jgi:hypothetical protein
MEALCPRPTRGCKKGGEVREEDLSRGSSSLVFESKYLRCRQVGKLNLETSGVFYIVGSIRVGSGGEKVCRNATQTGFHLEKRPATMTPTIHFAKDYSAASN